MPILSRGLHAASLVALLTGAALVPQAALLPLAALAQATPPAEAPEPGREIALTQARIDGLLAAQPELAGLSGGAADAPDPKAEAQAQGQAEAIVKRNGFASLEEFQDTSDTVDAVLGGIDPETKRYVGATPLLNRQRAALQADKGMPAKEKAEALKAIEAALATGEAAEPSQGNIALVTKNYARLSAAMGDGPQK